VEHRRVDLSAIEYDRRWAERAAAGESVHGEADLVELLLAEHRLTPDAGEQPSVLDAGCGTGRVAVELSARGLRTTGVDLDPALLDAARRKDPAVHWITADLATLAPDVAPGPFAAVVAAGNVMIFVARGTEDAVVANLAARLAPGGLLVAGFQVRAGGLSRSEYDDHCAAAGLERVAHYATWERAALGAVVDYVVAVNRRPPVTPDTAPG
jgi:predicted TPR repeat methyltransferase